MPVTIKLRLNFPRERQHNAHLESHSDLHGYEPTHYNGMALLCPT